MCVYIVPEHTDDTSRTLLVRHEKTLLLGCSADDKRKLKIVICGRGFSDTTQPITYYTKGLLLYGTETVTPNGLT